MSKWTTVATWEDSPHITQEMKDEYLEKIRTTEPHLLEVRTKGMPTFGSGLVYPVDATQILIPPFAIPNSFFRSYALDTGWNWNAAVFLAHDKQEDIVYVTDVFKRAHVEPPIVAQAIQSRGKWLQGVADAADTNRLDGRQYIEIYKALGLDIELPNKALETGITKVWQRMSTGKLRIFSTCTQLVDEMRVYMRDGKGHIKEDQDDHLLDGLRYGIMSALGRGKQPPTNQVNIDFDWNSRSSGSGYGWMA